MLNLIEKMPWAQLIHLVYKRVFGHSLCVGQAGLKLEMPLPQPLWNYRCARAYQVVVDIFRACSALPSFLI